MKAITVWQPWASLILIGAKPYEFRPSPFTRYVNPPRIGDRIAIQAGARPVRRKEVAELVERLEANDPAVNPCLIREIALPFLRRVLVGLGSKTGSLFDGDLVEPFKPPLSCIVCTTVLGQPKRGDECAREFGRAGNDSDRAATFNWGWPLLDVQPVIPHVEARGEQGFWSWHDARAAA